MNLLQSPPPIASGTRKGLLDWLAQTIGGVKTFLGTIVASAGIQVGALFNTNGTTSGDRVVQIGTSQADGSVHALAKLLSIGVGIGGTYVEKTYVTKDGSWYGTYVYLPNASGGGVFLGLCRIGGQNVNGDLELSFNNGPIRIALNTDTGMVRQYGVVSATVGADTRNNPKGINTLASGATSVTITNSLVTANSWVDVTFHADPGGRYWVSRAAGSFTVNTSAAPGANAPFSWEVSTLF